jgi:hypothetical protein
LLGRAQKAVAVLRREAVFAILPANPRLGPVPLAAGNMAKLAMGRSSSAGALLPLCVLTDVSSPISSVLVRHENRTTHAAKVGISRGVWPFRPKRDVAFIGKEFGVILGNLVNE